MGAGWILGAGSHWAGALLVTLTVLRTHLPSPCPPAGRVVIQAKFGCHFTNGTERVRFLHRHIYNRQQIAHFDSDLGVYVGDTELGRPDAEYWNKDPAILADRRALVDTRLQLPRSPFRPIPELLLGAEGPGSCRASSSPAAAGQSHWGALGPGRENPPSVLLAPRPGADFSPLSLQGS
uniref:MHC class II beta chain N-terminal domain-containing protein n=1 Tax=Chelonoidis abingdonii TaxID=106734 RepID=A0A8C0IXJ6_CHEAB